MATSGGQVEVPSMYSRLMKVEFDYQAQTDEELNVNEDDIVWIIEDDDQDWFKVKLKNDNPEPSVGLVPASYLVEYPPVRRVKAVFDYAPVRLDSGEFENEEEMEIVEGESLDLLIEEGDWSLVAKTSGTPAVGFVPSNYIEDDDGGAATNGHAETHQEEEQQQEDYQEAAPAAPVAGAYVDPSERVAASKAAPAANSDVQTWSVSEVDKKKKKKKGTLGVGNGTVFFASESDKNPVQQYSLSSLTDMTSEKSKHLYLTFPSAELHFSIPTKEAFDEVVAKIEEGRQQPRSIPPPPPSVPSAPAASGIPSGSTYVPPPPPIRTASSAPQPREPSPEPEPEPEVASDDLNGDAVALYDFEPQAADEIAITEGDRLFYIPNGSDDPDWVKVRKVGSTDEGVVPATYIQLDNEGGATTAPSHAPSTAAAAGVGAAAAAAAAAAASSASYNQRQSYDEDDDAEEEARRREEEAAEEEQRRADEARLAAQIERDAKLQRQREREAKERARAEREAARAKRKEAEERSKRMSTQPSAAPIPIPQPGDTDDEGARRRDRSSTARPKDGLKKPVASRVRTWKDRTGQFKVDAEFLGMNGKKIRLHKVNGVIIEVPIEKMSPEDTAYIKKTLARGREDEGSSSSRQPKSASDAARANGASSRPTRKQTDWFEFFLNAGCDLDDCTRYANNFEREKIEESILNEIEPGTLRSLGLREGDVIRVRKLIRDKYGPPPTPAKSPTDSKEAQIAADAQLAKELQGQAASPPPPNLFTGPDGGLKTTRRGRPARSGSSAVDPATLANAGSELAKKAGVPDAPTPPPAPPAPPAPSATESKPAAGFDDDAWTVKTPAAPKAASPPPAPAAPPKAPTPPPAPAASSSEPARPASSSSASGPTLTYNDGLLAQLGIGPAAASQQQRSATSPGPTSPSRPSFDPSAPRGPLAPVPANQGLLAPLVPTRTGMPYQPTGFNGMMPQPTGYSTMSPSMGMNSMAPLSQQFTGMNLGQSPFAGGIQMQPTGYQPSPSPNFMHAQPTGMQPSFMSPQQTGASFGGSQFGGQGMQPQRTGLVEFNPMPPSRQQSNGSSSNDAQKFEAKNVFASMKDGTFGNDNKSHLGPQDPAKYEVLRPQVTGMPYMQPQQTGFGMMQPQMTGYGQPQQPWQGGYQQY